MTEQQNKDQSRYGQSATEKSDQRGVDRGVSHTPGPWTITKREFIFYVKADTDHKEVAVMYADSDREANASLIAASPDLLAALKASLDVIALMREWAGCVSDQYIDGPGERAQYAGDLALALGAARLYQAVIAKAEGRA